MRVCIGLNCQPDLSFDMFPIDRYTTAGREILPQVRTGDVIRSAKLVEGQERLVLPKDDS